MDDPGGVRLFERECRLDADVRDLAGRQRARPDPLRQGRSFNVLHDDEDPLVVLIDLVDGADVRVVERGDGLRLVDQALPGLLAAGDCVGQHLDGHFAAKRAVLRQKDFAHPARAELTDDPVVAEC